MNTCFRNFKIIELDTKQCSSLYNLIDSNRKRLENYFAGTVKHTKTLEDTINYCSQLDIRVKNKSYFIYAIIDKESNSIIGLVDIKNMDWSVPKAEMGYFIDYNFQGKGITSVAVEKVITYIIKEYNFRKLLCRISSENPGSIKVALNNGFELEGTIRNDYRTSSNDIVDLNYYGRIF